MSPRVVVVTGASGGMGRATAVAFARRGDRVALLARGEVGLQAAANDVRAAGGTPLAVPVDVSDADAVEAAADRVEDELGPIDVWCNVAFTSVFAPFCEISAAEYARVTQVTYLGFVHGTMAALRRMKRRDRGMIVQTGSALAYRGIPLQSVYCGAKHAILGFTESLLTELRHDGSNVHVTMVNMPGGQHPTVRLGAEQAAQATAAGGAHLLPRAAKNYLDYSAFSRPGRIEQLEFEGYSTPPGPLTA
jgi:NAD(P)-dependent dehydrogenase (short-subunit alcohol dehydrogenase family)